MPVSANAAFDLLLLDPDARSASRGENSVAHGWDSNSWQQQPAALASQEGESLVLNYLDHVQDVKLVATAWSSDRLSPFAMGLALVHLDYGRMDGRDASGAATGDFPAGETLLLAGLARDLPEVGGGRVRAGVQFGWISGRLDDARNQALLGSAGVAWERGQLRLGGALRSAGVVLEDYGSQPDELPRSLEVGAAWKLAHLPFIWSVGWERVREQDPVVKLGGEFLVAQRWRLDLGYHVERGDQRLAGVDGEASRGFCAGLGGSLPGGYDLQWAWTSYGELGAVNRLSLAWRYRP